MFIKVLSGLLKHNGVDYPAGEVVEVSDADGAEAIAAGSVEAVEAPAKPVVDAGPSMDWTKQQLVDHATANGVEVLPTHTKQDILDLINGDVMPAAAEPSPAVEPAPVMPAQSDNPVEPAVPADENLAGKTGEAPSDEPQGE